ncbi:MAG: hypothetical protein HYW09_00200, partial [Candidatus Niyogibacteria bacterium]|nr:hypothetical protein [Candidatus Niyogibacteria bacterium]
MAKIKVGVLRGGPSSEYDVSLKTGEAVLQNLNKQKYKPVDILIDKTGVWYLSGVAAHPQKAFRAVDVIFNAMHGEYGEDGTAQKIFENHKIPYTGSDSLASSVAMQKHLAKEVLSISGILTPAHVLINMSDNINIKSAEAVRLFGLPLIVKPAGRGSSVGVKICRSIYGVITNIAETLNHGGRALAEPFIKGREATCAVIDDYRGEAHYAFPVVEIIPPAHKDFFDYESKYDGSSQEICPGRFGPEISEKIKKAAIAAHQSLGCRHYS